MRVTTIANQMDMIGTGNNKTRSTQRSAIVRLVAWTLCLCLLTGFSTTTADARSRTIFDLFFGNSEPEPQRQQYFPKAPRPNKKASPAPKRATPPTSTRTPSATAPAPAASPAVAEVEKSPDARPILVVGDFIGGGLAEGLEEAFASNSSVKVVSRTNGSSGFVRNDYFDWPANIGPMLEAEKPVAVVVMIGANDRQTISQNGSNFAPLSSEWTVEYQRRVDQFIKTIRDKGLPLIWIGQPPFKSPSMSKDLLALNTIYRNAAEKAGGSFADVWDGFIDEDGNFTQTGFDINGQTARLRANDGINITSAGKRKLAFYAEKPLRKVLGETDSKPDDLSTTAPLAKPALAKPVDRIAPFNIRDLDNSDSDVLLGGAAKPGLNPTPSKSTGQRLLSAPRPGRVDDFSWPRNITSPAAAN